MYRSELLPQPRAIPSKNSSGISDKSKELSKSSVSSKCLTTEQTLQGQIVQLKEKAHQSFMQVIQMQQLHEEELEQLRGEFADKDNEYQLRVNQFQIRENEYQSRISQLQSRLKQQQQLQVRVKQLQYENTTLQKNYKHHNCDFQQDDLQIDNIQLITCRQQSKLDDSAIINFTEIINVNRHDEQMRCVREEIKKEVEMISQVSYRETSLSKMVDKLFEYIAYVRGELVRLQEKGVEREKEKEKEVESKDVQNSKFYQSLQKETKFMTEHIKRLSAQKLKLQKRLLQLQRQGHADQERIRKIQTSLAKRGIKLQEFAPKSPSPTAQNCDKSLQINEFISQTFKNTSSTSSNPTHKAQYGLIRKTNKN